MDSFLDKDNVVKDFPSFDETPLIFRDDSREDSFQSGCNDLRYELITSIAQRDGPEPVEGGGSFLFWNQGKERRVCAAS